MSLTKATFSMIKGAVLNVQDFGAVGDGTTDDTASIQAALDFAGSNGGGTVVLGRSAGQYRITEGLKLPSFVTLEGIASDRYPYNSANAVSCLKADFTDFAQWVIEPKTKKSGSDVPYNVILTVADTITMTYNCGVKNLFIRSVGTMPFGGIRMHGCPGSIIDNVSVLGTGAGLLVNFSFGGNYSIHCETPYYGVIGWSNCNANDFETYSNQQAPLPSTVPSDYLMPFMNSLNGIMVSSLKLSTEDHYNRPWGLILGGTATDVSNGNTLSSTIEKFSGGSFQYYAYGTTFVKDYMEGAAGEMDFGVVASAARFSQTTWHCFMSGTGNAVDLGDNLRIELAPLGLLSYSSYGNGPFLDNTSLVTIKGVSPTTFGPSTPQFNVKYTAAARAWVEPTFINSWSSFGGLYGAAGYRKNERTGNVEFRGMITGGATTTSAFVLPAGYRPNARRDFAVARGGRVIVDPDGTVSCTHGSVADVALDGVIFEALL